MNYGKSGKKLWRKSPRILLLFLDVYKRQGFVSSDEILNLFASYQGQDVKTVKLKTVKKNQPTTVEITKSDVTTCLLYSSGKTDSVWLCEKGKEKSGADG